MSSEFLLVILCVCGILVWERYSVRKRIADFLHNCSRRSAAKRREKLPASGQRLSIRGFVRPLQCDE